MNVSIWGGLPLTCLPLAGALRVVLRFVWLYGNWAPLYNISAALGPLILYLFISLRLC